MQQLLKEIQLVLLIRVFLNLRFRLFAVQKLPFSKNQSFNFSILAYCLFIRGFVIRGPMFEERIYRE
jgi:hypothetical protein